MNVISQSMNYFKKLKNIFQKVQICVPKTVA